MKQRIQLGILIVGIFVQVLSVYASKSLISITYGQHENQLPGPQTPGNRANGIATSFQAHPDGGWLLLVPHLNELMYFEKNGTFSKLIKIRHANRPLSSKSRLADFDIASNGDIFLLDRGVGTVWHCSANGQIVSRFGHFLLPQRIDLIDDTVTIRDEGQGTVSTFNLEGKLLWQRKGRRWSSLLTKTGELLGHIRRKGSLLIIRTKATALPPSQRGVKNAMNQKPSRPRLFSRYKSSTEDFVVNEVHILGQDRAGKIYVMTEEGPVSHSKQFRLLRFGTQGQLEAESTLPKWNNWVMDLPRPIRVTPSGELIGFRWNDKAWRLVRYSLMPIEREYE